MKKPTDPFYTKISTLTGNIRAKVSYSALLGILVGLALTIMAIDIYSGSHMNYIVKIDNNVIGYVEKVDEFQNAVKAIELTDGKDAANHLAMVKTKEIAPGFITGQDIEKLARQTLGLKMPAVAVVVNGEELFKLGSQEDYNKVLDGVKNHYMSGITGGTVSILSSNVKESVEIKSILVDAGEVLDINGAVQMIIAGKGEKKKYVIKNGDTIWDIALKNGVSVEEIEDANPGINLDKIKIDQELNLATSVPYINMEIVADFKGVEEIPYETQQITDKAVAKGVTRVKQQGKSGQAEIEKRITVVNGMVAKEDVLKTNVIAKAVDKVVVVGSKAPTYNYSPTYIASAGEGGTGQFSWPSRGTLTSRFGRRWGRLHAGIDLANPTGTPVSAADGGTVVFAGYSGSFGNLIRISHGNGYQTFYAHLSKINVKVGQNVSKGQNIGAVGNTGRSTGPHLHFEVQKNGTPVNPLQFLK